MSLFAGRTATAPKRGVILPNTAIAGVVWQAGHSGSTTLTWLRMADFREQGGRA